MAIPLLGAISGVQGVMGAVQSITGNIKMKNLQKQVKSFQTPEEAYKVLNSLESAASSGFDAFTLNYMTNNINRTTAASIGAATKLGADPNDLSSLLAQNVDYIMKVGADNHDRNMANFGRYVGGLEYIAKNKEAEWASEQNILKDKIQAAAGNKAAGMQNIQNAVNTVTSLYAADKTAKLYKEAPTTTNPFQASEEIRKKIAAAAGQEGDTSGNTVGGNWG